MAKKGRKRVKRYFGPIEEEAVSLFLSSDDSIFRNEIYNKWLRHPFDKMVESIIRRYKLYRKGETFEDLHADTLSYLMMKSNKFDSKKGTKAYSYYGTVSKHYIMGLLIKDSKKLKQMASYDDVYKEVEEREDMKYTIDDDSYIAEFIEEVKNEINKIIELDITENENEVKNKKNILTDNEKRVGLALIDIFDGWEIMFDNLDGGNKFNKNIILSTIREATNLETKAVRSGMKKYKKLYTILKVKRVDNGLL